MKQGRGAVADAGAAQRGREEGGGDAAEERAARWMRGRIDELLPDRWQPASA